MNTLEKRRVGNSPVAENLEKIIEERALHQAEIARRAGLKPRNLCDIIKGNKLIRANEIETLAKVLNIGVEDLFRRERI
ncbi:MAG: helix-turn-helix transcriptional regulator [Dialister sp.]|uniref:helix-turn-helix domain-containing protein n=1 Tax=Dialister sp. TaxID=1955814 RepID=UPI00257D0C3B|nr:helix-turn-helix transcriptional regulator [Dialister sp.]MBS6295944.1 helix-turn-helix transcriptional regulator [Dialister sp.]